MFTSIEKYENINYTGIKPADNTELKVINHSPADVILLFNGREIAFLNRRYTVIKIDCDGILEIKNNSNLPVEITVENNNKNIVTEIKNTKFDRGISVLCEVNVN